ncbi:hypothetical protein H9657_05920 [Cellulomonas sp. Sa3CUA2]|uniref:DUF4178 domain-containing protein n=1 Tax=Cellulomonas avistercoris TaxID=2762242 RepID=A0ABR8QC00_9CELL|nr:hypothetical protein [Cellulomonas avistercoris]MBD7917814.1 hypothetical protein [Cellulomonas avistercoris]
MTRPRARMRLGKHLVGRPPWRSLPHGVVVYGEWDPEDRTTYYWEEWELLGYENTDFWVEYDHYTHQVTLYRPVEVHEDLDPRHLREGQQVAVTFGGQQHRLVVGEVGAGTIRHLAGGFTYDLQLGQEVAYAELKGDGVVLSVERFDDRVLDVYLGTVLDAAGQKAHFGRRVAPRRGAGALVAAVLVTAVLGLAGACGPTTETCTPRTVVAADGSTTTEQDCVRRSVFGSGGVGK